MNSAQKYSNGRSLSVSRVMKSIRPTCCQQARIFSRFSHRWSDTQSHVRHTTGIPKRAIDQHRSTDCTGYFEKQKKGKKERVWRVPDFHHLPTTPLQCNRGKP